MTTFIGQKVECLKQALIWRKNRGRGFGFKPFPIEIAYARQYMLKMSDPICSECGYKCLTK